MNGDRERWATRLPGILLVAGAVVILASLLVPRLRRGDGVGIGPGTGSGMAARGLSSSAPYPPPGPAATAAMTPVPGAPLSPPDGMEVVDTTVRSSPHGDLLLSIRDPLETKDWQALAALFQPSWRASPELLPIVEISEEGQIAFVAYDQLPQFFDELEALGSAPRLQGYIQRDHQDVGCIWAFVSGWEGPVAMETVAPWNPAFPTVTPTAVGNVPDRFSEGFEWLGEIGAGTYVWEMCPNRAQPVYEWTVGDYYDLVETFYYQANDLALETGLPILPYHRIVD